MTVLSSYRLSLVAVSAVALAASPALAVVWDGGTANPGDFNDPINWSTDMLPGAEQESPDNTSPSFAVIGDTSFVGQAVVNLDAAPAETDPIGDLRVGNGAFGDGVFNHSAGDLVTADGSWSFIAADGDGLFPARGEYNLSGTATFTTGIAAFADSSHFHVGIGGGRRDVDGGDLRNEGYITVADSAQFQVNNLFVGSNDDNHGQIDQTGGSVFAENWISVGRELGAQGYYNMSGGQLGVTQDGITVGESTGAYGEMNLSGTADVDAGRLRVGRSLNTDEENGGASGLLTITGDEVDVTVGFLDIGSNDGTLTNGEGTLSFTSESGISTITVLNDVTLNDGSVEGFAALEVDLETSPPAVGDLTLIDIAGTLTGTFMGLAEGDTVPSSGGRTITYVGGDGNDIVLVDPNGGGSDPLPGDADGDGDVDGDDLIAVQTNFGEVGATPLNGDADFDGDVDGDDLIAVQTNFGSTAEMSSLAVPEPSALLLSGLALLGFASRRR